jgi:GDP-mannose 6-dehydrogenase
MKISIFGLGYVGCVSLGCLSKMGHRVIGVDINQNKVDLINGGIATIIEKDIGFLIKDGKEKGLISATTDYLEAIDKSQITFICVSTPNDQNGHLDLTYIRKVAKEIALGIKRKDNFHLVVVRSTVIPGTSAEMIDFIAQISGKKANKDFCVIVNPEFLREGNAVEDYFNPGITVLGGTADKGIQLLIELYTTINGTIEIVEPKVAETIKLINNSFHALKVAFANEIGTITKSLDINTDQLIDVFLKDTRLNISKAYLRPGFAYGGSCLPKDLKALKMLAYDAYQTTPVISSIEQSNKFQIERAISLIEKCNLNTIGIWGISFKEGTDDLRNSPIIDVIASLIGKGFKVSIYDQNVIESLLIGANKEFVIAKLPQITGLIRKKLTALLDESELIIINTKGDEKDYHQILKRKKLKILDFQCVHELRNHPGYDGLNW